MVDVKLSVPAIKSTSSVVVYNTVDVKLSVPAINSAINICQLLRQISASIMN